jgi:ribosomal protein S18 acetylase RimI-like enzyme
MAALSETPLPHLVELRYIRSSDLGPMLDEETRVWEHLLDWDFRTSAGLVRRFVDMQALTGFCLMINNRVAGYSYFVCEERKGLIGDLYVMEEFATVENESALLSAVLDNLMKTPFVHRIESQLMMLRNGARIPMPGRQHLRTHIRNFMEVDLEAAEKLPTAKPDKHVAIDSWAERRQDEAATLIATAYQGHVDSEINDQYRSPAGARRFLLNIVQYPGCGSFFQPASYVAVDSRTHRLCGICLASLVHADVGHITQVCVSNAVRGTGVGYELLRQSLSSLRRHTCRKASLTVTAANTEAVQVYERMGFRKVREFTALVWEGF